MTNILAHNSRGDALVFTVDGRTIGPHETLPGDPTDPVTERLLRCGRLVEVGETEEPAPGLEPPAGNAPLTEWQDYAVRLGWDRADVEGMRRNELRDLLVVTEGDPEPVEPTGGDPDGDDTETGQDDPPEHEGGPDETTGTDVLVQEGTEPNGGAETDSEKETQ